MLVGEGRENGTSSRSRTTTQSSRKNRLGSRWIASVRMSRMTRIITDAARDICRKLIRITSFG